MRTDSVKKYVIPNIPYLFILWACLKLGTAYRLAPGADFAHKLMGLGQSIGPAFADFAPGLHPLDWLIGIVGAVGFRLLIYIKARTQRNSDGMKNTGRPAGGRFPVLLSVPAFVLCRHGGFCVYSGFAGDTALSARHGRAAPAFARKCEHGFCFYAGRDVF